jgi:hypothetical protein
MSQRGPKGGAPSRTEEAETGSLGKLCEGVPEIGIHRYNNWDTIIISKLEGKLLDGTQDLKSIKTEKVAADIKYERPMPSAADFARQGNGLQSDEINPIRATHRPPRFL